MTDIPRTSTDITTEWLTAVLGASGLACTVRSVRAEPLASLTATLHRLHVEYATAAPAAPRTLIWKQSSTNPAVRSSWTFAGSVYAREVRFYRELAPTIQARVPRCYLAEYDPETDEHVLLLEDLAPTHHTGTWPDSIGADAARSVLHELALLHAAHWGEFPPPASRSDSTQRYFDACLDDHRAFLTETIGAEVMGALARYSDVIVPWDEEADRAGHAYIHVDLHPGNVLLPRAGTDRPALIDWQGSRPGSAARDVGCLLTLCLDPEDRRAHERALVREYCAFLHDVGIEYAEQVAWRDYRIGSARQWLFAVTFVSHNDIWDEPTRTSVPYLFPRAALGAFDALNDQEMSA